MRLAFGLLPSSPRILHGNPGTRLCWGATNAFPPGSGRVFKDRLRQEPPTQASWRIVPEFTAGAPAGFDGQSTVIMPKAHDPVQQKFVAALDSLVAQVKGDRSILAAILCGSL